MGGDFQRETSFLIFVCTWKSGTVGTVLRVAEMQEQAAAVATSVLTGYGQALRPSVSL